MGGKRRQVKNYGRHRLLSMSSDDGSDDYDLMTGSRPSWKPKPTYFEPKTKNQQCCNHLLKRNL